MSSILPFYSYIMDWISKAWRTVDLSDLPGGLFQKATQMRHALSVGCAALLFLVGTSPLQSFSGPGPRRGWVDQSPHKSAFVESNGVKLHYLDWGGQGKTLVFLAGLGHNAHIFDDLAPRFTARFRVLAMTRRGFGLSDKPASGYDVDTRVADVLGFLNALQLRRVILVGHSIAGDELTAFAASSADRVESLIYLDAAYDRSQEPDAQAVREGKEPPGAPSIPKEALLSVDAYLSYFEKSFSREWSSAFEASLRDGIEIHPDGTVERRTPDSIYRAIRKGSLLASLDYSSVRPRTLSLYEDPSIYDDTQARKELVEEIDRSIALLRRSGPQVEIARLPGAGHYLFIDHLDDVVKKMIAFLQ